MLELLWLLEGAVGTDDGMLWCAAVVVVGVVSSVACGGAGEVVVSEVGAGSGLLGEGKQVPQRPGQATRKMSATWLPDKRHMCCLSKVQDGASRTPLQEARTGVAAVDVVPVQAPHRIGHARRNATATGFSSNKHTDLSDDVHDDGSGWRPRHSASVSRSEPALAAAAGEAPSRHSQTQMMACKLRQHICSRMAWTMMCRRVVRWSSKRCCRVSSLRWPNGCYQTVCRAQCQGMRFVSELEAPRLALPAVASSAAAQPGVGAANVLEGCLIFDHEKRKCTARVAANTWSGGQLRMPLAPHAFV